jgi:hypothetical protein
MSKKSGRLNGRSDSNGSNWQKNGNDRFGVESIVEIGISGLNGSARFVKQDTGETVHAELVRKDGTYELNKKWEREHLDSDRRDGIAKLHAPKNSDYFRSIYGDDGFTLVAIEYYQKVCPG